MLHVPLFSDITQETHNDRPLDMESNTLVKKVFLFLSLKKQQHEKLHIQPRWHQTSHTCNYIHHSGKLDFDLILILLACKKKKKQLIIIHSILQAE